MLVFGVKERNRVQELREFAEHPANHRREGFIPGDSAEYTMEIPLGFRVVYSLDVADDPDSVFRHLSVSRGRRGLSLVVMQEIAKLFDFSPEAEMGTLPSDPPWVIHVIEEVRSDHGAT